MQNNVAKWTKLMGASAVLMLAIAGCTGGDADGDGNTADSPESAIIQNRVDSAQNSAAGAASNVATAAGNVATAAGNQVQGAGNVVAGAGAAVVKTPDIKTAIAARMPAGNVNVDTMGAEKKIALRGTVQNAAQVKLAESIAKQKAPGYTIVNQLKAAGGASPVMKR